MTAPIGFPFPYVWEGKRHDGQLVNWPPVCLSCKAKPCEAARPGGPSLCSWGVNYQRIDDKMLVAGIILRDWPVGTQARSKRLREAGGNSIPNALLAAAVRARNQDVDRARADIEAEKARILEQFVAQEAFKPQFVKQVREDLQRGLAFFHDYKQINAQISQNINILIESRYSGSTLDDKLAQSHHAEKAIYEAAKFLEEKLNVAKFLLTPDWLYIQDQCVRFRVHGLLIKYLRIYQRHFESKGLKPQVIGVSHNEVLANPQACGVIPHTLLDNALKYSPRGGRVEIDVEDEEKGVYLAVSSFGPRIRADERERIFWPFFRGKHAQEQSEEGAGYGLYVAQLIAKEHLGTQIHCEQSTDEEGGLGFWTTFEVTFPERAKILV